jgi:Zn finger protein HypA/HybF involved in hydrogenase expression
MGPLNDEDFINIFNHSNSVAEIIRKCNHKSYSNSHYKHIYKRINNLGLDISKLEGIKVRKNNGAYKLRKHIVLSNSNIKEKSYVLRREFTKSGAKYKCSICNIQKWNNKPLRLEVDHIDGNNTNNDINNLRFICPNCHSQTDNWGISKGYNKKKERKCKQCNNDISKGNVSGFCFNCYKGRLTQMVRVVDS